MKKLNLGCGAFKEEDAINVDINPSVNPDVIHDLDTIPYPFECDYFDVIKANHVLEHLNAPFEVMKELYRILKPGGVLIIKVPHFSRGFTHADHKRGFDVTFPYYFNPKFCGYSGVPFNLIKTKLRWFAQPYLKKKIMPLPLFIIISLLGKVIDFFANLSPFFCSRCWCFLVGGFEEIEFQFKKI